MCIARREHWLSSCSIAVLCLVLLSALPGGRLEAADECTIRVTTDKYIGKNNKNESHTFSELEEIDRVVSFDPNSGNNVGCTIASYSVSGNVLTVKNSKLIPLTCTAKFTVEGSKKGCTPAEPATDGIAQQPLFLSQAATPNIMYLLDDSGSMQFELMPGDIIAGNTRYIFPRANGIHGGADYSNYVPTVDDGDPYNARSRSPQVNTIYYNPSVTYTPWIKSDGSYNADANPRCAPHNPLTQVNVLNDVFCRDLTSINTNFNFNYWFSCKEDGSCTYTNALKTFWPATYFWYRGSGDVWRWNRYDKVEIRPGKDYRGHGRESRDDCADADRGVCSYAEEIQNFANWYSYYRSRVATARAGSGFAFAEQGDSLRVGFGSLNAVSNILDGVATPVITRGVRPFSGADRLKFFDSLYGLEVPAAGTPLRRALDAAGKYFSRNDDKGPWGGEPGTGDRSEQLACRRNYTVLVTDGYWSGGSAGGDAAKNNDGTDNPSHRGVGNTAYTYKALSPFTDNRADTLADVAMHYWKNDLRPDLPNVVPANKNNPAFWQHMTTFGVGLGVNGTVDPVAAFDAVDTGATVNWPNPFAADVYKIDDLLHAAVNSRGGFLSVADPSAFANELSTLLNVIVNESKASASAISANSSRLDSGSLIYQASFSSDDWSGRIISYRIDPDDGSIGAVAWDSDTVGMPAAASRKIITSVGTEGSGGRDAVALTEANWNQLSSYQQDLLRNGGSKADGTALINWLRGDRSQEGTLFRSRKRILGDIVNSDPAYISPSEDYGFGKLPGAEGLSYNSYVKTKKSRSPVLLVGANDGMLHGFNAQNGRELFAYMPVGVFPYLAQLASPDYVHRYLVDGSPRVSDAYVNGVWRTVAVASTGAGGRSVFALDVSNPDGFNSSDVLWEFATDSGGAHKLGVAMSEPTIVRLEAGNKWVAIFGNGYNSGDQVKLFIVDLATGKLLRAINTEQSGVGNGLATPVPVDVDNDRVTDVVYAGDLKGNLWKFDLRGASPSSWKIAQSNAGSPAPLFVAEDDKGVRQPITVRPTVGRHNDGGYYVYFGTGKFFENSDVLLPQQPQVQDFYGIRDLDKPVDRDDLLVQDVIFEKVGLTVEGRNTEFQVRLVSARGGDSSPQYGWRLPLQPPDNSAEGERSVSRPVLRNGRIVFSTTIPSNGVCGFGGRSWLMELDAQTGGRYADPVLDTNSDRLVDELDKVYYNGEYLPISGRGSDEIIKTPGIIGAGDLEYKLTSGSSGSITSIAEKGGGASRSGRQSWRQLR